MMDPKSHNERRLLFVAHRALRGYEELPANQKVELLLGLAECLPASEAEAARATAWTVQHAEQQQLKFLDLLGDKRTPPPSDRA